MESETDLNSKLSKAISISTAKPKSGQEDEIFSVLKREMSLYEATCILTHSLKVPMDAILTIRPTSTQNERNCSTSRIFVTKNKSVLSDRAINASSFWIFHFKNDKF
jgi:hypothetical protein